MARAVKVWEEDEAEPEAENVPGDMPPKMAAENAARERWGKDGQPDLQGFRVRDHNGGKWLFHVETCIDFDAFTIDRPDRAKDGEP